MKIMTVVGARPNFMKAAPIIAAIHEHNAQLAGDPRGSSREIRHVLVHTGQHYDQAMSDSFFADLNLPHPDVYLGVGSASHAVQTAEVMRQFEPALLREQPDVLIVVGDVNSTIACALAAAKISFDSSGRRPLIAHVEAGLRSFDRAMPEEINRILTDHLADLLFVTEESGLRNLAAEGIPDDKVHFVGNTMIDSLRAYEKKAESSTILSDLKLTVDGPDCTAIPHYALLTLHRPANADNRDVLLSILDGLEELARECPIIFPAHPRTWHRIQEFRLDTRFHQSTAASGDSERRGGIRLVKPLGYLDFLQLMKHACLVVTDSGGIQEETTCLGIPCVTVRENTERPVTIEVGTNVLAGITTTSIRDAIRRQAGVKSTGAVPEKWDGRTANRILDVLIDCFDT